MDFAETAEQQALRKTVAEIAGTREATASSAAPQ